MAKKQANHVASRRTSGGRAGLFRSIWKRITQKFTIMLIPHSERAVLNFHVSAMTIFFSVLLLLAVAGGFVYLSSVHIGASAIIQKQSAELVQSRANLDSVLGEVQDVLKQAQSFDQELTSTVQSLGIELTDENDSAPIARGDLASFFNLEAVGEDSVREVEELQNLSDMLAGAISPLRDMRDVLDAQKNLLSDLPNYWPVGGGRGFVTMEFGPNIHPVTGQWYLHKGFDIAGTPGLPVVASANGKVVELGFDPGYGMYVWLRHKWGFRTRYSHLQSIGVSEGEDVAQGQRIGTLGNSGISTGAHLDFQVWLGTDVVDPAAFLTISNDFNRWSGNR